MCMHVVLRVHLHDRLAAEQRLLEVMSNLEKATAAHSEQVTSLQDSLVTQKQLTSKYNDKVCGSQSPTYNNVCW